MYGELADDEWRIVALAGAVAERIDEKPCIEAALLADALRAEPGLLSGVDAELAAGFVEADVERCLCLVKKLWHEIASEAGERSASESAGHPVLDVCLPDDGMSAVGLTRSFTSRR
jgi:hypothetical protein